MVVWRIEPLILFMNRRTIPLASFRGNPGFIPFLLPYRTSGPIFCCFWWNLLLSPLFWFLPSTRMDPTDPTDPNGRFGRQRGVFCATASMAPSRARASAYPSPGVWPLGGWGGSWEDFRKPRLFFWFKGAFGGGGGYDLRTRRNLQPLASDKLVIGRHNGHWGRP